MFKNNPYISETGHLKDEYISLYIDAQILNKVNELPKEVLDHVEKCLKCKHDIINGYELLKNIDDLNVKDHPYFNIKSKSAGLKKIKFLVLYKIAASLIFIISVGLTGYYFLNSYTKNVNKISKNENIIKDSTKIKNDVTKDSLKIKVRNKEDIEIIKEDLKKETGLNELIAENTLSGEEYQISPIMLSMLGATTRSGFFEVEQPKDSTIFENKEQIKFIWESDINEDIKLKIFNYKDELIFESEELKTDEFIINEPLSAGAYIWKIESTDKIYHLGLFFVKK